MAARKPLIAGNWKMYGRQASLGEIKALWTSIEAAAPRIDAVICPPALYVAQALSAALGTGVAIGAQEILMDASVSMKPDEEIGLFKGLSLLPSVLKARKNPGEATLRSQVPADVYERWMVQKKKFLGSDGGVEKWRPLFAADKLRREAFDDLGLRESGMVWDVVGKLAKKHKIKTTRPSVPFTFPTEGLKDRIKEFSRQPLADQECFATTLGEAGHSRRHPRAGVRVVDRLRREVAGSQSNYPGDRAAGQAHPRGRLPRAPARQRLPGRTTELTMGPHQFVRVSSRSVLAMLIAERV